MAKYSVSVEVNRPIEEAWEVFMDESKMGEWLEGYKSMEVLEENLSPSAANTR